MFYSVDKGKILTSTCEVNVSHHCNLACRACSHLSPVFKKHHIDPDQLFADLSTLAKYYHAERVRLLGGEPLLHPDLFAVIEATRTSGVCDRIRVVTNGMLLPRMPDAFWQRVDEVYISVYPGKGLPEGQLQQCERKASLYHVDLHLFFFDRFRVSYSEWGTQNTHLIRRIYRSCQIAHRWRCHNVQGGYFFKCPQSLFLPQLLGPDKLGQPAADGLKIDDSPTFAQDLLDYLESPEPLASCHHCLGSIGQLFPHEQVLRSQWRQFQQAETEALIDLEFLDALEAADTDIDTLCLRPDTPSLPGYNLVG
jgi:organic radical activating enzyme